MAFKGLFTVPTSGEFQLGCYLANAFSWHDVSGICPASATMAPASHFRPRVLKSALYFKGGVSGAQGPFGHLILREAQIAERRRRAASHCWHEIFVR